MGQSSEQVYSWEACLFNVRGLDAKTKNDNGFRAEFINGGRYKLICMCEPKLSEELDAWGGEYSVFHCPRKLRNQSKEDGGVLLLLHAVLMRYRPERMTDHVPPETVALLFKNGAAFGIAGEIVVIGAYVTNYNKVYKAYSSGGKNLFRQLEEFILLQRSAKREVLLLGDLNAYTGIDQGWDGSEAQYCEQPYVNGARVSQCSANATVGRTMGRELLRLTRSCELRIVNGLKRGQLTADGAVTRLEDGSSVLKPSRRDVGSVIDYIIASEGVLQSVTALKVGAGAWYTDHRPVRFQWNARSVQPAVAAERGDELGPIGWRFAGKPCVRTRAQAAATLAEDVRLPGVTQLMARGLIDDAYALVLDMIREAWSAAGIVVN